ncbi:MAG: DUF4923 family protein [Muribaculum sp.]|nr:DUF4923 family protein [Muribaculum sp.]
MKFLFSLLFAAVCTFSVSAQSFDLGGLLKGALGSNDSTSTGSSGGGILGNILGSVLGNEKVTPKDMVGVWKYSSPAVTFQSDNFLQKAGGAAAAATIEEKMSTYYNRAGVNNLVLTVEEDSTFTMKFGRVSLGGNIEQGTDSGELIFHFTAFKSIKLGSYHAYAMIAGNTMSLTFDISKLMDILNKVTSIVGNSSLKTLNSLLQSYDGMRAGFKLTRTSDGSTSGQ